MKNNAKKKNKSHIAVYIVLLSGVLITLLPFLWMLLTSLKTQSEAIHVPPVIFPAKPVLSNYSDVFRDVPFARMYLNTIISAAVTVAAQLLFCSMAAYAFAKLKFPGRDVIFVTLLAVLMVPPSFFILPQYLIIQKLGLLNTIPALFIPNLFSAFGTFLLRQFFLSLPSDLEDAVDLNFAQGDVVNTIITCAHGETIAITLDTKLPRFYTRAFQVQGTKAMYMDDNHSIFMDGKDNADEFEWKKNWDNASAYYDRYDHPVWKAYLKAGVRGSHDGMDWLVFKAFFDAVREKRNTPVDVYDSAAMMAVTPLSEQSICRGGMPAAFPDFTNGAWITRKRWEPELRGF